MENNFQKNIQRRNVDQNPMVFFYNKRNFQKTFEGEILINNQVTIFLQIFYECMIILKVIFKNIKVPDDSCRGDL